MHHGDDSGINKNNDNKKKGLNLCTRKVSKIGIAGQRPFKAPCCRFQFEITSQQEIHDEGLRRRSTETRRRFENISLPCARYRTARQSSERTRASFPVAERESLGAAAKDAFLLNLMIISEEPETGRGFDSQRNRRPPELAGIPNEVAIYSQRDQFPVPHAGGGGHGRSAEAPGKTSVASFHPNFLTISQGKREKKTGLISSLITSVAFFFYCAARSGRLLRSNEFEKNVRV